MASICTSLIKLNIDDQIIFKKVKRRLINVIEKHGKEEGMEILHNEIKPEILSQYFHVSMVCEDYDFDYLYLIENLFLNRLDEASFSSLVSMVCGHHDWANSQFKIEETTRYEKKKIKAKNSLQNRFEKKFKQFNDEFLKTLAHSLNDEDAVKEINIKAFLHVLRFASRSHIKKNEV